MSKQLYDPPKYISQGIFNSFNEAVKSQKSLSYDVGAMLGVLYGNYPTGDRTLFNEIKRQPWLSSVDASGKSELHQIPPHGLRFQSPKDMSRTILGLLKKEALEAIEGVNNVYILTSGGLDSRIVCGVLKHLFDEGRIKSKPICLTWSSNQNSRDYVYAKKVSEICNFDFEHLPVLGVGTVIENIENSPELTGCFFSPIHLHSMCSLKKLDEDSIVFAGSYGDSIGRAEFSGSHLLEISNPNPQNAFNLLKNDVFLEARSQIITDLHDLRKRGASNYPWAINEHVKQGWYMRGMIGHAMNVVNRYCKLYQMFTSPYVYEYIWSLHPCCRNNEMYAELLELLDERLARLPWARTNKALKGKTIGEVKGLQKEFQKYEEWISGPIYEHYSSFFDINWFENTGIFSGKDISELSKKVRMRHKFLIPYGIRPYELWVWLVSIKKLAEPLSIKCNFDYSKISKQEKSGSVKIINWMKLYIARCELIRNIKKTLHRKYIKRLVIKKYPFQYNRV